MRTRLTDMFGIKYPIVMGGMTGVGTPELAAAVSNAGGLGIFAAHNAGSPEGAREWIKKMKKLTDQPWGVNLTILPTLGPPPPYDEYVQVFIDEKVKIVETAGSDPRRYVYKLKDAGIITIHKCVSIKHALTAEHSGIDVISLDGFECAGHPGEGDIGNFVLQPRGFEALKVPYLCSGGVGNGMQLAASIALGADGVNLGTRICITKESNWPESYKKKVLASDETNTLLLLRALGNTSRVFKNGVAEEAWEIEQDKGRDMEIGDVMHLISGKRGREAEVKGDTEDGIWSAGQGIGLIHDVPTVAELIENMMNECRMSAGRLQSYVEMNPSN